MEHLRQIPLPQLTFGQGYPANVFCDLQVQRCTSFVSRLLGVNHPASKGALLFPGTRGLHGLGLGESLWVVWLDANDDAVKTEWLHPGGFTTRPKDAVSAVEVTLDRIEEALCDTVH